MYPQSCPKDSLGTSLPLPFIDRRERMGHLDSIELPDRGTRDSSAAEPAKSRWWLWVVVLALAVGGIWYYRGTHSTSEAGGKAAPGAYGKGGPGDFAMFGPVPVVVATAQ